MKGAALLLVACAAFAALCSVDATVPAMNYQGGYSCAGKIAKLDCYVVNGVVKGLVYQNTNDGEATAICDYPFINGGPDWSDKALVLQADEAIISVEACRGGYYGYSKITVTTDKGKTWTCGGDGGYSYKPPSWNGCGSMSSYKSYGCYQPYDYSTKYNKWSPMLKKYSRGLLAAEDVATAADANEGRQLQADETGVDFWHSKGWGWGWKGMCSTYRSPKQPKWSTCGTSRCNNWWTGKTKRSGSYGYVGNSAGPYYYGQWKRFNTYYKYNSGGKTNIYYHSRTLYNKYSDYCAKNSCNYVPKSYYDESYPLASFSGICDKSGYIYNLYGFCWNDNYTPPTPPNALIVEMIFESDSGLPCVNIDGTPIQIEAVLGQMNRYLQVATGGTLVKEITYYATGFKCTPGSGGTNSTSVVAVGFVPADGKTVADILAYFQAQNVGAGTDLCSFPPITDPVSGTSITPCVVELDSAVVNGYDGMGVTSKKKKLTVGQAMDKIETKYAGNAHLSRRYSAIRQKHVSKKWSSYNFKSATYADIYMDYFKDGHKANMKKYYGNDYKKKLQQVYQTYKKTKTKTKGL